ncbi:MAG: DUF2200 family protein [Prevotella sp.]
METNKVYQMPLSKVYPLLVAKTERKGRTENEVRQIVRWITGYTSGQLAAILASDITYSDFFRNAPQLESRPPAYQENCLWRSGREHCRTADA